MEHALLSTIYKSGDKKLISNYRRISVNIFNNKVFSTILEGK